MDGYWWLVIYISTLHVGSNMNTFFKGYLLLIGLASVVLGLWGMFAKDFSLYPIFGYVERGTSLASFIRTMSGVFVASWYILIWFIFSSSKVQLGTVLIYLVVFMLFGKFIAFFYEGFLRHDIIAFILGFFTLLGLIFVHRYRKNLISYDL